ncbi:MAG: hypothetical protein ACE5FT_04225 [Candidatus Nanoarchaeia archaeon]
MADKETIAVTLVALIALVGLVSSGATGAAGLGMPEGLRTDQQLGLTLGAKAFEMALESDEQQNRACSYACQDLCPASDEWSRTQYQKTEESECSDFCKIRCESLLRQQYQLSYRGT